MAIGIERTTRGLLVCLLFIYIGDSYGQSMSPEEEYTHFRNLYPEEQAVYLQKNEQVYISHAGDSLLVKVKVHEEILLLGENFPVYASDKVYSSPFLRISDLKAYTLIPGKRKEARMDVTEFKESQSPGSNIFYDDQKAISFTYPGVQKGAKTVLDYQITVTDPRLLGYFSFNAYIPVHSASYAITFDDGINIQPHLYNTDSIKLQSARTTRNNRNTLTFSAEDLQPIPYEDDAPSQAYRAATVYCMIRNYKSADGQTVTVLDSVKDLHRWYRTFVKGLNHQSDDVQQLVDSLVTGTADTLERVRRIFNWVQTNVKYIAFEEGMRGFVPHSGSYVISKRYGDCKDMASTIVDMLRAAGVKARYTWVGTRDLPYSYTEIASPIVDNHMIATFTFGGKLYFLDATGAYMPIDMPSSMIQGKECLISKNDSTFEVARVPVVPKEDNLMTDTISVELQNGSVMGRGEVWLTGYAKIFNTYKLVDANMRNVDDYVRRLLTKGSNKFILRNYSVEHLRDVYQPLAVHYQFNIPDYYRAVGNDIYINLVLDRTMSDALLDKRKAPLENEYKYVNRSVVVVTIPDGYSPSYVPPNQQNDGDDFGFSIKYRADGSRLIVTREFYVNYLIMGRNDFSRWDKQVEDYASACRSAVVLSRKQ